MSFSDLCVNAPHYSRLRCVKLTRPHCGLLGCCGVEERRGRARRRNNQSSVKVFRLSLLNTMSLISIGAERKRGHPSISRRKPSCVRGAVFIDTRNRQPDQLSVITTREQFSEREEEMKDRRVGGHLEIYCTSLVIISHYIIK